MQIQKQIDQLAVQAKEAGASLAIINGHGVSVRVSTSKTKALLWYVDGKPVAQNNLFRAVRW